ncbi:DNA (cytosine-5-)-methyltransferase, partial [Vibrio parahaemolyticus]
MNDIWNVVNEVDRLPKNVFLATASFPCTDLSVAGARKGLVGEQSGTLKAFLSIVEKQKLSNQEPVCILLENVQGFLTSHKGADVS